MAQRPAFFIQDGKVRSELFPFEWFPGFSLSQKRKSIDSLHRAIQKAQPDAKPLEISTKGPDPAGVKLSAFNLRLHRHTLENIFQSAKVFEGGGPYPDLLDVPPKEAKRDERLKTSGPLKAFRFQNEDFPLSPLSVFYDYIYLAAVKESLTQQEIRAAAGYTHFTDIEFNPEKSINTQARTVPMIKLLLEEYGYLPDLSKDDFIQYHKTHITY